MVLLLMLLHIIYKGLLFMSMGAVLYRLELLKLLNLVVV